jgi:HJR/Mrr/RecB family endonuclease
MPFLPFLIVVGVVIIAIQKIAENAPITGITCTILAFLVSASMVHLSFKKKALKEATRRAIISEFKWTDNLDPLEFEQRCAEAMQLSGWAACTTRKTGDQGVDVLADKRGTKVVLQCKLYTNTVGNKAVQEVFAAKTFSSSTFAAVVSNTSYTRAAKELAQKTGVLLLHYSELRQANLLFGFPADGVPALQYQRGVTPSDVKRARHFVIFWLIASLPALLIGQSLDAAHNNQSGVQASTIAPTGSQEPSPVPMPTPLVKQIEYGSAPSPVIPNEDGRNLHLSTEAPTIAAGLTSTIEPKPPQLPMIGRKAALSSELNQTFRDMIIRTGRPCMLITDHVWLSLAHVSLMCDRKLRVAFIQEPQGWRFARTGE